MRGQNPRAEFLWLVGVEPFLDVAVILICSRTPEGFLAQHTDKRGAGDVLLGLVPVSRDREGCLFADNGFLCPFLVLASATMARESVYK